MYVKYPSTPHLPCSPGLSRDDTVISDMSTLASSTVVITEKMDGENTTMYCDHMHARSLDSRHHPSRDWVKAFWSTIASNIPPGWRVCGENLYARHSVFYHDLSSYFLGFSVWDSSNTALDWYSTQQWFDLLGITSVPVLYRGPYDSKVIDQLIKDFDVNQKEGFVVRTVDPIPFSEFSLRIAKWVRPNHVQTDTHWMHQELVPNKLT